MSAGWRQVRNTRTEEVVLARAKWCTSFWCHFRGLQLRPRLPEDEGIIFVTGFEGRAHVSIHMLFVLFDIAVIWVDKQGKVVDKAHARPWRLAYAPAAPAQYYIEANPSLLARVDIGDILRFESIVI